jgi:hypothetical protein
MVVEDLEVVEISQFNFSFQRDFLIRYLNGKAKIGEK